MSKSRSLSDFKYREFENFIFDLLVILGIRNLVWRTPGADGGRDLQGEVFTRDFSGEFRREVWYVECKVRQASLSWPDVFEKIAYAKNHGADTLLICCNSTLSPKCKDEINAHNSHQRRPALRFWEAGDLLQRVELKPALASKYGLAPAGPDHAKLAPLMHQGMKAIQAAYSAMVGASVALPNTFHLAQALSEFCGQFAVDPFQVIWKDVTKSFDDVRPGAILEGFDSAIAFPVYSLNVAVAAVGAVARTGQIEVRGNHDQKFIEVRPLGSGAKISESLMLREVLREVSILSDIEIDILDDRVVLKVRK